MDYYTVIKKAIDFIEDNLYEDITIQKVSDEVGFSVPHFYRIFHGVVGESFKSYMRKRRVSEGLILLRSDNMNIGRIAFELGFESHEVFIRSFKKIYEVSPKESRSIISLPLYERIDVMKKKANFESDVIRLETQIILRKSFKIMGKSVQLNQAEQVENNLIDQFLQRFEDERQKTPDLKNESKVISMYEYDPECIQKDDEEIDYLYTVGVELNDSAKCPEGYDEKIIPESKYAVFVYDYKDKTLNGEDVTKLLYEGKPIESVYDYIDGVWILNSGFTLSDKPDFEIRDAENKGIIEYYISIED